MHPTNSRLGGLGGDEWTLFQNVAWWQDEGTPGYNLATGQPVLAEDRDRAFWKQHGYGGTERIVCLDCWSGLAPDVSAGTTVPLVYREPTDRQPHFAHPKGKAHDSVGGPGESVWHLRTKRLLQQWASEQSTVLDASLEWTTSDHSRRADVRVRTSDGTLALEAQQRTIAPSEWRARRQSSQRLAIRDYWFWPTTTRYPETTVDGLTSYAIDPEQERVGLIVSMWPPRYAGAGVEMQWPPLRSKPLAALWAPLADWTINGNQVVPPQRLVDRCHQDVPSARPRPPIARPSITSRPVVAARSTADDRMVCMGCGGVLDPLWNDVGGHPGC